MSEPSLRELVLRRYAVARDLAAEVRRVEAEGVEAVKVRIETSDTWSGVAQDVDALGATFGGGYALTTPSVGRWWSASPKGSTKYLAGVGVHCAEVDGRFALVAYTQMNPKIPGLVRGYELRRGIDVAALGDSSGWDGSGWVGRSVVHESTWERLVEGTVSSLDAHVRFQVTLIRTIRDALGGFPTK